MPEVTFFANSPGEVLMATNDPHLVAEAIEYRDDLVSNWQTVKQALD